MATGRDAHAEREYGEDEVREILDLAVAMEDGAQPRIPAGRGLTLPQLQEIAREAGIEPARVEEAALIVAARGEAQPRRTSLGMPIAVGRAVALEREPTDREWDTLVGELRETFGALGRVSRPGGIRAWRNGNLHALVEPTPTGWRLRLATLKGRARARNWVGIAGVAVGLAALPFVVLTGDLVELTLPGLIGGAALGFNWITLNRWARRREEQMERIASRATELIGGDPEPEGREG